MAARLPLRAKAGLAGALLAALACGAGGANAQERPAASVLNSAVFASDPARKMSYPLRSPSARRFEEGNALRAAGLARTAVDGRLGREDMVGALGFLCGRPDNLNTDGAADLHGHDPHGRFVGARLSLAF